VARGSVAGFIFGTETPEICPMTQCNARRRKNSLVPNRSEEISSQLISVRHDDTVARFSPGEDVLASLGLLISRQTIKLRLSNVQ
jgi:hypothetical protein